MTEGPREMPRLDSYRRALRFCGHRARMMPFAAQVIHRTEEPPSPQVIIACVSIKVVDDPNGPVLADEYAGLIWKPPYAQGVYRERWTRGMLQAIDENYRSTHEYGGNVV